MNDENLRVCRKGRRSRVLMERSELAGELDLLRGRQTWLVGKKNHLVTGERLLDIREISVVQIGQIGAVSAPINGDSGVT